MLHWDTLGLAHPSPLLGNPAHRSEPRHGLLWRSPSAERPNATLRSGPREQHRAGATTARLPQREETLRGLAARHGSALLPERGALAHKVEVQENKPSFPNSAAGLTGVSQQIPTPAQARGSSPGCLTVTPTCSAPVLAPTDNDRRQESPARQRSHLSIAA